MKQSRFFRLSLNLVIVTLLLHFFCKPACSQLTPDDIERLRQRGRAEGWTFTVGENSATKRPLEMLCGSLPPPEDRPDVMSPKTTAADLASEQILPDFFDWRQLGGCTPIKDQGNCGSCWAFSSIGAVESAILIHEGVVEDLSEQWLISCTDAGDCAGGYHSLALDHFMPDRRTDQCDDAGGVLEADLPYIERNAPCNCPYEHYYFINYWYYTGTDVNSIKQAIYNYGPVPTNVYADTPFQAYTGGVFNACDDKEINHSVVLVGWDDNQGTNGVWIMRNSWGDDWGEDGYMRIEYGCSSIGRSTCFVNYTLPPEFTVEPKDGFYLSYLLGQPLTLSAKSYTLTNNGTLQSEWTADVRQTWLNIVPESGTLAPSESVQVLVSVDTNELGPGVYTDTVRFTDITHGLAEERQVKLDISLPALQVYWKLDETEGTTAADSTGNGYTAVVFGDPNWLYDGGIFAGTMQFDGIDDYMTADADVSEISYALSLWFKTSSPNCGIFSAFTEHVIAAHDRHVYLENGNVNVSIQIAEDTITAADSNYADGSWHHIVHTFGGAVGPQKLYVDGDLKATGLENFSDFDTQTGLKIGFSQNAANPYFAGLIDDVRICNYAVTEDEVQRLYRGGRAEVPAPRDGATYVSLDTPLTWLPGNLAVSHDIFFGTDYNSVDAAENTLPPGGVFKGGQTENVFTPDTLRPFTVYYWRIDEILADTILRGKLWSFATICPGNLAADSIINLDDFTILARYWLTNETSADIAPPVGDGVVDSNDLSVLTDYWLGECGF